MKDDIPDWKVQTSEWNVEDSRAWRTEDTDKFFYEIEEKKMIKRIWKKIKSWFWNKEMIGVSGYELRIHSNTDNFILFTGLFV